MVQLAARFVLSCYRHTDVWVGLVCPQLAVGPSWNYCRRGYAGWFLGVGATLEVCWGWLGSPTVGAE